MSGPRLAVAAVAWLLAAAAIGVVLGVLVVEAAGLVGLLERGGPTYARTLDVVSLGVFVTLLALPFLLRRRTLGDD